MMTTENHAPHDYKGLILDVDGTLVNSNDAHARAWVAAFKDEGQDVAFEKVRPYIGMGADQMLPRLGVKEGSPLYERLTKGWQKHFEADELAHIQPQPGAKAFVEAALARGLKLVVGSSGEQKIVEKLLDIAGVAALLPLRTTSAEVEASKPAPDIVQAALKKLGLSAEQILMVGDTPYDIESARRSKVGCVVFRCGGDDRFEGAVAVFDSPADWAGKMDGAPLEASKR